MKPLSITSTQFLCRPEYRGRLYLKTNTQYENNNTRIYNYYIKIPKIAPTNYLSNFPANKPSNSLYKNERYFGEGGRGGGFSLRI